MRRAKISGDRKRRDDRPNWRSGGGAKKRRGSVPKRRPRASVLRKSEPTSSCARSADKAIMMSGGPVSPSQSIECATTARMGGGLLDESVDVYAAKKACLLPQSVEQLSRSCLVVATSALRWFLLA